MGKQLLVIAVTILITAFCTICATMRFLKIEVHDDDTVSIIFVGNVWEKEIEGGR